jgi:hypothetical protein
VLVYAGEGYLVIARVGIQKAQELTFGLDIYDLVYAGQRKLIFCTCLVQARVLNTHPPFPILFFVQESGLLSSSDSGLL